MTGDLHEGYAERADSRGRLRARLWLWRQTVKTAAAFLLHARRRGVAGVMPGGGWAPDPGGGMRKALRSLARSPGFTAASIGTLALGIGAVTAMFTVLEQIVLRPLPVRDQDGIVVAWTHHAVRNVPHFPFMWEAYQAVQEGVPSLARVAATDAWGATDRLVEIRDGEEEVLKMSRILGDYFGVLDVAPVLGRTLRPEDGVPGAEPVAVISHAAWTRHYGRSPDAVGSVVRILGETGTVVGVLPSGFDYPRDTDIWVALPPQYPTWAEEKPLLELDLVARLQPGASKERVAQEITSLFRTSPELRRTYEGAVPVVKQLDDVILGDLRGTVVLLFSGALLVLLVAYVNVASLVEVRAAGRDATVAVRRALGASRWRLVRESLAEAVWLGALGGIGGALVAAFAVRFLVPLAPAGLTRVDQVTPPDTVALLVTAGFSGAVVLLIAALPVIRAGKVHPATALRGAARSTAGLGRRRRGIVVTQTGLAVWSAAVAMLLLRSLLALEGLDLGFRADELVLVQLDLPSEYFTVPDAGETETGRPAETGRPPDLLDRLEKIDERVEAHPAVDAVTPMLSPPLAGPGSFAFPPQLEGQTFDEAMEDNPFAHFEVVQPDYFRTLQLPILRGRAPAPADGPGARPVVVVNDAAARLFWPGQKALGQRITAGFADDRWWTVIGVATDARYQDLVETRPVVYFPFRQLDDFPPPYLLARTTVSMETLVPVVRDAAAAVDPRIRVKEASFLRARLEAPLARPRFAVLILGMLAGATLFLAAVGVYGVMAAAVRARTAEMGVRLACGATPNNVRSLVLRHGMLLSVLGAALGGVAVLAGGVLLESLLFRVAPSDPRSLGTGALLVLVVALLACWIPAKRAARLDPACVLRAQ